MKETIENSILEIDIRPFSTFLDYLENEKIDLETALFLLNLTKRIYTFCKESNLHITDLLGEFKSYYSSTSELAQFLCQHDVALPVDKHKWKLTERGLVIVNAIFFNKQTDEDGALIPVPAPRWPAHRSKRGLSPIFDVKNRAFSANNVCGDCKHVKSCHDKTSWQSLGLTEEQIRTFPGCTGFNKK